MYKEGVHLYRAPNSEAYCVRHPNDKKMIMMKYEYNRYIYTREKRGSSGDGDALTCTVECRVIIWSCGVWLDDIETDSFSV